MASFVAAEPVAGADAIFEIEREREKNRREEKEAIEFFFWFLRKAKSNFFFQNFVCRRKERKKKAIGATFFSLSLTTLVLISRLIARHR